MRLIAIIFISLSFGANDLQPDLHLFSRQQDNAQSFNIPNTLRLVGIMAQFPIEDPDHAMTSGNGRFLSEPYQKYIKFINSNTPRCSGTLVDPPPHNSLYFKKQLEAVGNYYNNVSNNI